MAACDGTVLIGIRGTSSCQRASRIGQCRGQLPACRFQRLAGSLSRDLELAVLLDGFLRRNRSTSRFGLRSLGFQTANEAVQHHLHFNDLSGECLVIFAG
jgi:hypothetical protein